MRRFTFQAAAVLVLVGCLTFLTGSLGVRSGFNTLWMFGLPIAVASMFNRDAASRCLAGLALVVLSLVATMATAAVFGLGP